MTFTQRKVGSTKSQSINLLRVCLLLRAQWVKFPVMKICLPTAVSRKKLHNQNSIQLMNTSLGNSETGSNFTSWLLNAGVINNKLRKGCQKGITKFWHLSSHTQVILWKRKSLSWQLLPLKEQEALITGKQLFKYRQLLEELVLCCPIPSLHSCHIPITAFI